MQISFSMHKGIAFLLICHFQAYFSSILQGSNGYNDTASSQFGNNTGLSDVELDFIPRVAGNISQVLVLVTVGTCSVCSDINPGDTITFSLPGFNRGSDASLDTSQLYELDDNTTLFGRFNVSSWNDATSQLILTCTGSVPQGSRTLISVPSAAGIMLPKLGLQQNQVLPMTQSNPCLRC